MADPERSPTGHSLLYGPDANPVRRGCLDLRVDAGRSGRLALADSLGHNRLDGALLPDPRAFGGRRVLCHALRVPAPPLGRGNRLPALCRGDRAGDLPRRCADRFRNLLQPEARTSQGTRPDPAPLPPRITRERCLPHRSRRRWSCPSGAPS
jgi:hypothetical protein